MSTRAPRFFYAGESAVVVEFGDSIDMETNKRVQVLRKKIESCSFPGFIETVPTYRSLAVYFNPLQAGPPEKLEALLLELSQNLEMSGAEEKELLIIPTCYGGEFGPDLDKVASRTGLSADEVIRRHSAQDCYCYMLGFVPGYPYLGGMDPSLETPRLKEPREKIPVGSVGIGGKQTGIYTVESPGGWNLIGRTPLRMFDPDRPLRPGGTPAIFLNAGMWVRFSPIDAADFELLAHQSVLPDWQPDIRKNKKATKEVIGDVPDGV
ncbi:MAG: 5-oxoprolinase subunit PxpB [Synergistaceae bacterium]|jgi:KipI family sensor histidine kinase inhibitor|nr:5-oxoprolinase subunit PxpB [Synergistaceae bacterium]